MLSEWRLRPRMKYFWLQFQFHSFCQISGKDTIHTACPHFSEGHSSKRFLIQFFLIWIHLQRSCFSWWNPMVVLPHKGHEWSLFYFYRSQKQHFTFLLFLSPMTMLKSAISGTVQKLDANASRKRICINGLWIQSMFPPIFLKTTLIPPYDFFTKEHIFLLTIYLLLPIQTFLENHLFFRWEFTAEQWYLFFRFFCLFLPRFLLLPQEKKMEILGGLWIYACDYAHQYLKIYLF